jgi:hypothetical protein
MAFTAKFKKFVALLAVTGGVCYGVYYMKTHKKPIDAEAQTATASQADTAAQSVVPTPSPVPQSSAVHEAEPAPTQSTPVQQSQSDPSQDRGMKFLLDQGKK